MNKQWPYTVPGIPDSRFTRGNIPMTKEEARLFTVCRARPAPGLTVWDIGAGTGTLSVEMAHLVPGGRVFAVERTEEGVGLIRENCRRFALDNVTIIYGEAPEVLAGLPAPHRVLVGGSGGRLKEILAVCAKMLVPGGHIVLNALTPSTLSLGLKAFNAPPFLGAQGVLLHAARLEPLGGEVFFRSQNPVWILSAQKEE